MTPPVWLIAEREFRAYAATLSFWIALAVGPLAMAGALGVAALAAAGPSTPGPSTLGPAVAVVASDPAVMRSARAAVSEVAALEGRRVVLAAPGGAGTRFIVEAGPNGLAQARFEGAPVLSPEGQALAARTVERDVAVGKIAPSLPFMRRDVRAADRVGNPSEAHGNEYSNALPRSDSPTPALRADPPHKGEGGVIARFAMVMMLWLTLTGSLGMLLQAVVRERATRALESLLAAAAPWEIVFGKLAGVGAVSLLVLASWLGSAAALAPLVPGGAVPGAGGVVAGVLRGLADPVGLARAGVIYILAYAFYGLVTVAVGAAARDTAAAQNLSRPMFTVLLAAFFAALAAASGAGGLGWLVYAPPFTPFMLLLQPPGAMTLGAQLGAVALLAAGAGAAGVWAVSGLGLTTGGAPIPRFWVRRAA